jgi:hypothetical protein
MSDVVAFEGMFEDAMRDLRKRKIKKLLKQIFEGQRVRVRIERIDEQDEWIYQ